MVNSAAKRPRTESADAFVSGAAASSNQESSRGHHGELLNSALGKQLHSAAAKDVVEHVEHLNISALFAILDESASLRASTDFNLQSKWRCKMFLLMHALAVHQSSGSTAAALKLVATHSKQLCAELVGIYQSAISAEETHSTTPVQPELRSGAQPPATTPAQLLQPPYAWDHTAYQGPVPVENLPWTFSRVRCQAPHAPEPWLGGQPHAPMPTPPEAVLALTAAACTPPSTHMLQYLYGDAAHPPCSSAACHAVVGLLQAHLAATGGEDTAPSCRAAQPLLHCVAWSPQPSQLWCVAALSSDHLVAGTASGQLLLLDASLGGGGSAPPDQLTQDMQHAASREAVAQHPPLVPSITGHVAEGGHPLAAARYGFGAPPNTGAGTDRHPQAALGERGGHRVASCVRGHSAGVACLAVAPCPARPPAAVVVSGAADGSLALWRYAGGDADTSPLLHAISSPVHMGDAIAGVCWVTPPSHFAALTEGGVLSLWEVLAAPSGQHSGRCERLGSYTCKAGTAVGVACLGLRAAGGAVSQGALPHALLLLTLLSGESRVLPVAMLLPTARLPTSPALALEVTVLPPIAFAGGGAAGVPFGIAGGGPAWDAGQRHPADERSGVALTGSALLHTGHVAVMHTLAGGHAPPSPPSPDVAAFSPQVCSVIPVPAAHTHTHGDDDTGAPAFLLRCHLGQRHLSLWDCARGTTVAVLVPATELARQDSAQDYLQPAAIWLHAADELLLVAVGTMSGAVQLWVVDPFALAGASCVFLQPCLAWHAHCAQVNSVAWLPLLHAHPTAEHAERGLLLCTASDDGCAKVWGLSGEAGSWNSTCLQTEQEHTKYV